MEKSGKILHQDVTSVFGARQARLHESKTRLHKEYEESRQTGPEDVDVGEQIGDFVTSFFLRQKRSPPQHRK